MFWYLLTFLPLPAEFQLVGAVTPELARALAFLAHFRCHLTGGKRLLTSILDFCLPPLGAKARRLCGRPFGVGAATLRFREL